MTSLKTITDEGKREFEELWGNWDGAPEGTTKGIDWHIKAFLDTFAEKVATEMYAALKQEDAEMLDEPGNFIGTPYNSNAVRFGINLANIAVEQAFKSFLGKVWKKKLS